MADMGRQQARIEGQVTALTASVAQSNVTLAEIGRDVTWIRESLDKKVDAAHVRSVSAEESSGAASGRATMARVLSIIAILAAIIAALVGVNLPLPG